QKVIDARLYGDVTVDELRQLNAKLTEYFEAGHPPVHRLMDLTDITTFPKNLGETASALQYLHREGSHIGVTVVCGASDNPMLSFISSTLLKVTTHGLRLHMVRTRDEAVAMLSELATQ
ncbi:MAG: hypothetical protein K8I30_10940, partial [Anaerolineae bacterium]|nr:hypothetical protein [Anaerolineae bacterium]